MKKKSLLTMLIVVFLNITTIKSENLIKNNSLFDYNINKYNKIMVDIRNNKADTLAYSNLIIYIAKQFLGTPYKGGTLEGKGEFCRVNFKGMDCVTFPENVFAIARTSKKQLFSYTDFIAELAYIRYMNLPQEKYNPEKSHLLYSDRIHYSSEWIFYHTKVKKTCIAISESLGGKKIQFETDFMINNTNYYPPLKDINLLEKIKVEYETNKKRVFYYIPQNDIDGIEKDLQNGDFVFFVSNRKGLDYNHTGIIYIDNDGKCKLMHASSGAKKIVISNQTLSQYVKSIKSDIGITVVRPK